MYLVSLRRHKVLAFLRFNINSCRNFNNEKSLSYHAATLDGVDYCTNELLHKQRNTSEHTIRYFMGMDSNKVKSISDMDEAELNETFLQLVLINKDKQVETMILECCDNKRVISYDLLKKLLTHYSGSGKPNMIMVLTKYTKSVDPNLHKRNGEFIHYIGKAQCLKGNSEKGLSLLEDAYKKYTSLRSFYRIILKELIHDSVLNRSEATLVIFKKYVLRFSLVWHDHYPLICFWYICWSSSWFSDQMTADELLESSLTLREIVKEKAVAFSITILRVEYNEDAVVRLLQTLLKYDMMAEYAKVLQTLFNHKLKNGDLRGCTEIIKNCKVLGINLPAYQQGRYIKMLITGKRKSTSPEPKDFKLKF